MTYTIVFKTEALDEYLKAYDWYEDELKGLGERFQQAIDRKLNFIAENAELYHQPKKGFHQAIVQGFPYVIVYRIKPQGHLIFISAVYHTSRNPRKKYRL